MKVWITVLLLSGWFLPHLIAQEIVGFKSAKKHQKIPFELVNNLILIPVTVNGVPFRFILDSGVSTTLMFNNQNVVKIYFDQQESYNIVGLGAGPSVKATRSKGNIISIKGLKAKNQDILLIDETNFEFMQRMGTQIDGIIGHSLFNDFLVRINYSQHYIQLFKHGALPKRHLNKTIQLPLTFHNKKPFVSLEFEIAEGIKQNGFFLIDSGSSDALWLFEDNVNKIHPPVFDDFLGRGISGNIFGKRGKIPKLNIGGLNMTGVKVAYPDRQTLRKHSFLRGRVGSLGGELLKRFTVIFDAKNKFLYLKPYRTVHAPFYYNMSGIEIQYSGVELVKERITSPIGLVKNPKGNRGGIEIYLQPQFRLELYQLIEVFEVRPGSPAAVAGILKGDMLQRINGRKVSQLKLHEIVDLLQKKPGQKLHMIIRRGHEIKSFKFHLKPLF